VAVNHRTARVYSQPALHRALRLQPVAVRNLGRMGQSILSVKGRSTFVSAVRAVITPSGQLGDMIEHEFVGPDMPTLIVWSAGDPIIPVSHAVFAHQRLPASRLEIFGGANHEPHRREAERFATSVADFIEQTAPAV
jgi:pimeloyl-ACP methyl ester carboxylesterase